MKFIKLIAGFLFGAAIGLIFDFFLIFRHYGETSNGWLVLFILLGGLIGLIIAGIFLNFGKENSENDIHSLTEMDQILQANDKEINAMYIQSTKIFRQDSKQYLFTEQKGIWDKIEADVSKSMQDIETIVTQMIQQRKDEGNDI